MEQGILRKENGNYRQEMQDEEIVHYNVHVPLSLSLRFEEWARGRKIYFPSGRVNRGLAMRILIEEACKS